MPFKATVKLRPKQMKDISPEQLYLTEKAERKETQMGMYSWLLKRKKQGKLGIEVQDPNTTISLLTKARITEDDYSMLTPRELAEILGVDAIILGTFETTKPIPEVASVALGVLVGFYGSTNKAIADIFIYNAKDGSVLGNYNKALAGSIVSCSPVI